MRRNGMKPKRMIYWYKKTGERKMMEAANLSHPKVEIVYVTQYYELTDILTEDDFVCVSQSLFDIFYLVLSDAFKRFPNVRFHIMHKLNGKFPSDIALFAMDIVPNVVTFPYGTGDALFEASGLLSEEEILPLRRDDYRGLKSLIENRKSIGNDPVA
jgi:hypothetical protein